jgi:hypothetical protein
MTIIIKQRVDKRTVNISSAEDKSWKLGWKSYNETCDKFYQLRRRKLFTPKSKKLIACQVRLLNNNLKYQKDSS